YDGVRFHRIDLGGAAGRMELDPRTADHLYRAPPDSFNWPEGSESGQAMLSQTLEGSAPGAKTDAAPGASAAARPTPAPSANTGAPDPSRLAPAGDERPRSSI